jgi:DNA-binding response OmpR family regulator
MTADSLRRDSILVVDDTPETLGLLTDTLDHEGFTVLIATDGESALDLLEQITPDLVLMDALMPGIDGFETCRRLKRERMLTQLPVIFMTGLSDTEHVVQGLAAGGVDYVTKPIVIDELLARIRVHLANARTAQGTHAALDAAGRFLLASNSKGRLLWCTPKAKQLLGELFSDVAQGRRAEVSVVSRIGPDEFLLRVAEIGTRGDEQLLQQSLSLTSRESEVLLWISCGKSNREIGEILTISPRTVNKHLEQIFVKLGVENRASAAARAVRTLAR